MIKCNTPDCKFSIESLCTKANITIYNGECVSEVERDIELYDDEN